MTRSDIFDMLMDDDDAPSTDPIVTVQNDDAAPVAPPAERAIDMDRFDIRQAEHAAATFDYLAKHAEATSQDAVADYFAAAYKLEPQVNERVIPEAQARRDFLDALQNDPDYQALRQSTVLQTEQAALAAHTFAVKAGEAGADKPDDPNGPSNGDGPTESQAERESRMRQAAHAAAMQATEEVATFNEGAKACGVDPGNLSRSDASAIMGLFHRIKLSRKLKRIMELAGRWRLAAAAAQRQKVEHGHDEVMGVECGADLSRVIPAEYGRLAHEGLRLDFMRRFAERSLFQWEMHAEEKIGRGPIVICLDESGSMYGENESNAKALSLAMLWIARKQNRDVHCIGFSGPGCIRECAFPKGRASADTVAEWLEGMIGGGTDFETPLRRATEIITTGGLRKADVIFITDGIAPVTPRFASEFADLRKRLAVKCIGLVVGSSSTGPLPLLCDKLHVVNNLAVNTDAARDVLAV